MQGGDADTSNGVIQLAARQIFDKIKRDDTTAQYKVKVSYLEIYIEDLVDLLADSTGAAAVAAPEIRGDTITNLVEREVGTYEDLIAMFRRGDGKKTVGSTNMNHRSSRSHSIFRVTVEKRNVEGSSWCCGDDDKENSTPSGLNASASSFSTSSVLSLVDLAGSESAKLTGATGQQLKEGGAINQR
jgi:centromeric protein E